MNAIGIILAGGKGDRLGALTQHRTASALPVGSCYRAIDFPISNMTNAGIKKIAIITQYNSRSLQDHLSSAKWWNLGRKQGGLFVLAPYISDDKPMWFRGTADSIYQNISFLKRSKEEYVVISSGNCIYKMDFSKMLKAHKETGADITIAYRRVEGLDAKRQYGFLEMDENGHMLDFEEKPLDPKSNTASIGVYIIRRELLIDKMEELAKEGRYDLVRDLFSRYRARLNIFGYHFDGYWRNIGNIKSYFNCNMEFLKSDVRKTFTTGDDVIYTKPKDEPPAKFNGEAKIANSLVSSGSIFDGEVTNSIIFRSVRVGVGTIVENSIIMEGTEVGNGCTIKYAILDKDVKVREGTTLIGRPDKLVVVGKGEVVSANIDYSN